MGFGVLGALGLLLTVTGLIVQAAVPVVIGLVIGLSSVLACWKFVRFRGRRRFDP